MSKADKHDYLVDIEQACEKAVADGFVVVDATDLDLFVDIDSKKVPAQFYARVQSMVNRGIIHDFKMKPSKGGNWHAYCKLPQPKSIPERIALQCVLGSDLTHEYLSLMTYMQVGDRTRIVFFEKPGESQ